MAIINSIVMGLARNKIGNVVLNIVKGKTIAKQYQPIVNQPNTPAQIANQNKIANCARAYNYCKAFWLNYGLGLKSGENFYNAFVRNSLHLFPATLLSTDADCYRKLWNREFKGGFAPSILECNVVYAGQLAGSTEVLFLTNGEEFQSEYLITLFAVDSETGNRQMTARYITENEWLSQVLYIAPITNANDLPAVYVTNEALKTVSNVMFWINQ